MSDDLFEFSRLSTQLEWYKAYDDPANRFWIDGAEYQRHPEWDERQKQKWRFFYRPQASAVGRPQRKMINERQTSIANQTERIAELDKGFILVGVLAAIGVGVAAWLWVYLLILPVGFVLVKGVQFLLARGEATKAVEKARREVTILDGEVRSLLKQIPSCPSAQVVDGWRREEIEQLEYKCLSEILNVDINASNIKNYIRHKPITAPVNAILIDSWGLLQPSRVRGQFGDERTGLDRVRQDIGGGIATFRRGPDERPIYRLMYLQFIYLLEKNLNVYGFFYDFVTRRQYGKRSETFQYNHVSNFSIREVELEEEAWVGGLGLAAAFTANLFGKEINAFSLAVTGGASFRCVLVDEAVVEGMNEWLKQQEKWMELQSEAADAEARQRIEGEIALQRKALKQQDLRVARAALQQVREQVEHYAR